MAAVESRLSSERVRLRLGWQGWLWAGKAGIGAATTETSLKDELPHIVYDHHGGGNIAHEADRR
jgi:hypothetical protein